MTVRPQELSLREARLIALGSQGLAVPRPRVTMDRRQGKKVLGRMGLLQIDSVNVVVRSQELPLFARLGHHPRDLVARMTRAGDLFEYWGHEASHLPISMHPLLRWRMEDAREGRGTWGRVALIAQDEPDLVADVLRQVRARRLTVGMVEGGGRRGQGMWAWSPGKVALEYLFWSGQVTARRGANFERWYDLPERSLPAAVLDRPTPDPREAKKELLLVGARCHGVGTAKDLADYFRLNVPESRPLLAELVAEGRLEPVRVQDWHQPAYLHPAALDIRWPQGRALLSPFDPLVWERSRTERLFGFRYRIEIYVPKHKRLHGYYVLPFLLGDELVARVDLKADRRAGVLRVQSAHREVGVDVGRVATELAAELRELSAFLGLPGGVSVQSQGGLSPELARAVTRQ